MANILVLGDTIIDEYIFLSPQKISDEAPVITQNIKKINYNLGGGSNVARNLASLNNNVTYIGLQSKKTKNELTKLFKQQRIKSYLFNSEDAVPVKTRLISKKQQIDRFDTVPDFNFSKEKIYSQINSIIKNLLKSVDCVVVSKYFSDFLTPDLINPIIEEAKKLNIFSIFDNRQDDTFLFKNFSLLKLNSKEFNNLVKKDNINKVSLDKSIKNLKKTLNYENVVITRAEENVVLLDFSNTLKYYEVAAKEVVDVSGAGDTFVATLATFYKEKGLHESIYYAIKACSVVVKKLGTATLDLFELSEITDSSVFEGKSTESLVISHLKKLKIENQKIVFTNGVFDILHSGHIKLLAEAKSYGDVLVVGINSDKSTKLLKGSSRPINDIHERIKVLSALKYVDYVIPFEELNVSKLLKKIKPDVYVKGGDYSVKTLPEKDSLHYCEKVIFVKLADGKSTTKIVEKIFKKEQ
ncbi:PfkB family carbohydrate kinase [[Mycoplasma] testudinis]|uniref:PfkB family carbohydrate kinase n=1 Tax=[Mycoplasma] testudinis TaxID=33924 RepID=UPI000696DA4F|nr:PfkB family carbohydrate kinase [[Mycoplasma] testudinis]